MYFKPVGGLAMAVPILTIGITPMSDEHSFGAYLRQRRKLFG
ncbi:MAG TPA: hypothetical protein VFH60_01260 [Chloroflexia bacterium]|nr:hypothetical protein [Chloroflexia bacterium]